ncbi:alpha/beta hydrolase [uncultured Aquimarina sp.]|uniref:alpha/beta fold hydrolase n=1 Tax=uncultured Aquimarina sp. TaxID=575652 RepID=UPI002602AC2E|nr:alpha/beta hydrolase [uncultured Aquimarina sp.]
MKILKNYLTVLILSIVTTFSGFSQTTTYSTEVVDDLDIFYREAGSKNKPALVLLHGYPTSSFMFRNLIEELSTEYHLIAPDYPGYGRSSQPAIKDFDYTFDNMARIVEKFLDQKGIKKYSLYVMDYGAPVGYRIFSKHPERVQALIVQNGNAYEEGLGVPFDALKANWANNNEETRKALEGFHTLGGLEWQYTTGVEDPSKISPDNWYLDYQHIQRPENNEIQLAMFYDYRTNVALYPEWHKKFRKHQPPTLIVWGENDPIFPGIGAVPYKRDLNNVEIHLLNTGHFALEDKGDEIAAYIRQFFKKNNIK